MINVLIVDDEPLAQDVLETHVSQMPELNLVTKCSNALEAQKALEEHSIDLMFLDIQMPQVTGVEFLKSLENPPLVIFTTAYSNYAVEGFELNALDYLLKPVSFDRFSKAVEKAKEQIALHKAVEAAEAAVEAATEAHIEEVDHMYVKSDKKLIRVKYSDILYIEGLKDYVIIRMEVGRLITLQTMKSLEDKLPSKIFRRVHRSFIVAIPKIHAIEGNMIEVVEKGQPKHLPIGKNYRDELLDLIDKNRL
jgi:DNA-binding LytR/AlgR family response regulator